MPNIGRTVLRVANELRRQVSNGLHKENEFLPPLRQIANDHDVAYMTVVRAVRLLEQEGVVASEPRRGYRVARTRIRGPKGHPFAFLTQADSANTDSWSDVRRTLLLALQTAAQDRGWSALGLRDSGQGAGEILEHLVALQVAGVVSDFFDPELAGALQRERIPWVLVNDWSESAGTDAIVQDNYHGGFLAAQYLLDRGCRKIGWVGGIRDGVHSHERYGGAMGALRLARRSLAERFTVATQRDADVPRAVRALFSKRDRPDGILCLWRGHTAAVKQAADACGLVPGIDFHMVGWSLAEHYADLHVPQFGMGPVAPAIVWSAQSMAEIALARLLERRANPDLPALRINVPTSLRLAGKAGKAEEKIGDKEESS